MTEIRGAAVSGRFYPADREELEKQARDFLLLNTKHRAKAVIAPHAGYIFSGNLAGKVISRLKQEKDFIILGVNHSGFGNKICFSSKDFSTPIGVVSNNQELGKEIEEKLKNAGLDACINEKAHEYEHSIEVELPFLQTSQKELSVVPVVLKDLSYEGCIKTAEILSDYSDKCAVIVSSDFTHYGLDYGFAPFKENVRNNLYKLDRGIIDSILNLDSKRFYEKASESTVCGLYGITILTEIAKLKKWKAELIDYYTSGDISGEWHNAVGYAGIVFS